MMPYENATSGQAARAEITKTLQRFGCDSVGFMDEFHDRVVLLAFTHRGRNVQLRASAKGWAAAWLKDNPYTSRRRATRQEWEERAIRQGMVAVNSILRDWVKGQVTAVECGMLSFEHVFVPYMLSADGKPMIEHMQKMLPAPQCDA
jgi:hypothetical protein